MYSSSTDTSSHWCFQPCLHNCPLSFFKPVCFNFNFQSSPLQPRLSSVCLSGYSGSLLLILPSESLLSPLGFVPTLSMLLLLLLPSRCSTLQVLRCALTSRSQNIQKNWGWTGRSEICYTSPPLGQVFRWILGLAGSMGSVRDCLVVWRIRMQVGWRTLSEGGEGVCCACPPWALLTVISVACPVAVLVAAGLGSGKNCPQKWGGISVPWLPQSTGGLCPPRDLWSLLNARPWALHVCSSAVSSAPALCSAFELQSRTVKTTSPKNNLLLQRLENVTAHFHMQSDAVGVWKQLRLRGWPGKGSSEMAAGEHERKDGRKGANEEWGEGGRRAGGSRCQVQGMRGLYSVGLLFFPCHSTALVQLLN